MINNSNIDDFQTEIVVVKMQNVTGCLFYNNVCIILVNVFAHTTSIWNTDYRALIDIEQFLLEVLNSGCT